MAVIELDGLAALDALQWLRTGEEVVRRFDFSPATVSRRSKKCLRLFGIDLRRIEGEWCTTGDTTLLQREREVHQWARWLGHRPLRLEATYWSGPLLCTPVPERWLLGLCNIVGVPRNFQLVRERVVDVFVTGLPDLPSPDDPDLTGVVLSSMPVFFVAGAGHPLAGRDRLSLEEIARYPSLALPAGSYPRVEAALRAIGLWNDPVRMHRYRRDLWEGRTEAELTIGYGTPLSLAISGDNLVRLPLTLPFRSGEALVVRREFAACPEFLALRDLLLRCLRDLAACHGEIEVIEPGPDEGCSPASS